MHQHKFKYILLFSLFLFGSLIADCNQLKTPDEIILFDFESDHALDEVNWKCHTLMSISDEHVTHGKGSLMLELYPSNYPGFHPFLRVHDWHRFNTLCFDVFNPDEKEREITVRIDDRKGNTEYADRFNRRFTLKKGRNHIVIKTDSLITSGTNRKMDLDNIDKFLFFIYKPDEKAVLYVDYVRLVAD